jgi:hypothetical protein
MLLGISNLICKALRPKDFVPSASESFLYQNLKDKIEHISFDIILDVRLDMKRHLNDSGFYLDQLLKDKTEYDSKRSKAKS